ncbi:GNAT family N-acetyltransferase [Zongyangia hominis]|uniref:GNAT family N-acetyltransferase n=1 Tax=Zongyangia hominis TaxID=2763677 RepID=A0A926IBK0_9FIRM|nr:GNAT family N-acetyltransferase [Zongyangia hominis]MBC8570363.1 GNAT family N-acetyltransferase [Zongyangia hominis]
MKLILRDFKEQDLPEMRDIWNEIVEEGVSFPGEKVLSLDEAREMFASQTRSVVALQDGEVVGVYILHPNNIGRCGHIANASYGVKRGHRGEGIGEQLVRHSLDSLSPCGFRGLQFNAVVAMNRTAIVLYERLGFDRIGVIPGGYHLKDGSYEDIIIFYRAAPGGVTRP